MTEPTEEFEGSSPPRRELPLLRGRFEIDPAEALPALAAGPIPAFAAHDQHSPDRRLMAYVCRPDLPIRLDALSRLRKASPSNMLPLINAGTVRWPLSGGRALVVLYQRPLGGSLAERFAGPEQRPPEHEIPRRIVAPMVRALRGLETLGIAHRGIRADNLYYLDETGADLVLGDCVTAPPGFAQPQAMEPIDRAMASPAGRGDGTIADDLYALGVMLLQLVSGGRDFGDDAAVLAAKANHGSFAALSDRRRVPSAMVDPLRGLLADDPARRWGLEHLENWLTGQVRPQSRGGVGKLVPAPFIFAGRPYTSFRLLAQAFADNVGAAAEVMRSGELHGWLTRRANAEKTAEALAALVSAHLADRGTPQGGDDYLVAKVAALLDPEGPVRFRGLRFMRDGVGPALAVAWLMDGDARTPVAALALGLADAPPDATPSFQRRRPGAQPEMSLARMVEQPGHGGGLERCLYATNPGLACRSPLIADVLVIAIEGLLAALDEAAERCEPHVWPIDRHIAAFIMERSDRDLGPAMKALSDRRQARKSLAMLTILANLQDAPDAVPVPALARWCAHHLDAVVQSFQSRTIQENLRRRLPQIASRGRLKELLDLLDDPRRRHADKQGASAAAAEFARAEARIQHYQRTAETRRQGHIDLGQQSAATISLIVGFMATWASLVVRLW